MPAFLLPIVANFLANPLRYLTIAGYVAGGLFVAGLLGDHWWLSHQVARKDAQIVKLNDEKQALVASVENLNLEVDLAKKSREKLEQALTNQQARAERDAKIQKEIDNAPKESDGPIAPVLRRALERM